MPHLAVAGAISRLLVFGMDLGTASEELLLARPLVVETLVISCVVRGVAVGGVGLDVVLDVVEAGVGVVGFELLANLGKSCECVLKRALDDEHEGGDHLAPALELQSYDISQPHRVQCFVVLVVLQVELDQLLVRLAHQLPAPLRPQAVL